MFEGGEGAGKSTAILALDAALRAAGHAVTLTREPGGTPEGLSLRALLLAQDGPDWAPEAELLLMTAARVQHVRRVIQPALDRGETVLCDRYLGSTLAYQGAGSHLPRDLILDMHARLVGGLLPDLTVLLDIDPRIGLRRSARRLAADASGETKFEALPLDFHDRVRADFLAQAREGKTLVIDAAQPQREVARLVLECLNE